MHFLYYRFLFHIKTWTLFSDWVHIFLINFFLGLQLQLQICLLGVRKMNDFMMFVTECTKENQNWALGRQFVIENLKRWRKLKKMYESHSIQVIWCCGYTILDFHCQIWGSLGALIPVSDGLRLYKCGEFLSVLWRPN